MGKIDPSLAHSRRLLAFFVSQADPNDQRALSGVARWDGSALWIDGTGSPEKAVLVAGTGAKVLIGEVTDLMREALREDTGYGAELESLVEGIELVSFSHVSQMPENGLRIPGAFTQAFVPGWRAP